MLTKLNINKIAKYYLNPRLITAKQLDVNTIVGNDYLSSSIKNYAQQNQLHKPTQQSQSTQSLVMNSDTLETDNIVNGNISSKYRIIKYIGDGINGKLYLAKDSKNNLYICKKIYLDKSQNNDQQIEFELNILKYLSNNKSTRDYINPCLEHKIVDDNIFTIFPVFNGYSLNNLQNYLVKLNREDYYKIIFYLIKNILEGIAVIHKCNIAHQNINGNAILVATTNKSFPAENYDMPIKFTDFGLGCGSYKSPIPNNMSKDMYFNKCDMQHLPVRITKNVLDTLKDSDYLKLCQKHDIFCVGVLILKLLLPDDGIKVNSDNGYTTTLESNILSKLKSKYLRSTSNNNDDYEYVPIDVKIQTKRDIKEYLDLVIKNMITKTKGRQPCQYVLDKIIIYEKYKDEVF
jgi:serine/threonine protein kinase